MVASAVGGDMGSRSVLMDYTQRSRYCVHGTHVGRMLAGEEREEGQRERRGDVLFSGWAEFGCLLTLLASGFGAGCRYSRGTNNTRRLALTGVTGPQGPWLTAWLGLRGMAVSRGGLHKPSRECRTGRAIFGAVWSRLWRQCLQKMESVWVVLGFRDMGLGAWVRGDLGMGKADGAEG